MKAWKTVLFVCVVVFFVFLTNVSFAMESPEVLSISEKYRSAIHTYTKRFGKKVSPLFVHAIVLVESHGNPRAHNKRTGAKGLMQITSVALEQVRQVYPRERFSNDLFNPDNNIKVGVAYLTHLLEEYDIENRDALAVGFSSGPKQGERYSQRPKKNRYVHKVKEMTLLVMAN